MQQKQKRLITKSIITTMALLTMLTGPMAYAEEPHRAICEVTLNAENGTFEKEIRKDEEIPIIDWHSNDQEIKIATQTKVTENTKILLKVTNQDYYDLRSRVSLEQFENEYTNCISMDFEMVKTIKKPEETVNIKIDNLESNIKLVMDIPNINTEKYNINCKLVHINEYNETIEIPLEINKENKILFSVASFSPYVFYYKTTPKEVPKETPAPTNNNTTNKVADPEPESETYVYEVSKTPRDLWAEYLRKLALLDEFNANRNINNTKDIYKTDKYIPKDKKPVKVPGEQTTTAIVEQVPQDKVEIVEITPEEPSEKEVIKDTPTPTPQNKKFTVDNNESNQQAEKNKSAFNWKILLYIILAIFIIFLLLFLQKYIKRESPRF